MKCENGNRETKAIKRLNRNVTVFKMVTVLKEIFFINQSNIVIAQVIETVWSNSLYSLE